ncbi:hypothetical protein G6F62_014863 [Rhizopus arrhizus]|nr:hypothetical protein G6F62_014863 [Rhizopus arrhizus]
MRERIQYRHRGVGHGQRAAGARLGLVMQVAQGRARDMRTGLRLVPRQSSHAMLLGRAHQLVIGRMKLHGIDAMALRIMRTQSWPITVGIEAEPLPAPSRCTASINATSSVHR